MLRFPYLLTCKGATKLRLFCNFVRCPDAVHSCVSSDAFRMTSGLGQPISWSRVHGQKPIITFPNKDAKTPSFGFYRIPQRI